MIYLIIFLPIVFLIVRNIYIQLISIFGIMILIWILKESKLNIYWIITEYNILKFQLILDNWNTYFLILNYILGIVALLYINKKSLDISYSNLIILMIFLINWVFLVEDILYFYILFESTLIPIFILIGIYGSRTRKHYAGMLLFIYTLLGSLFFLWTIFLLQHIWGTTDFHILSLCMFDYHLEIYCFLGLFFACGVKLPIFPLHLWLIEAHVEAPTLGSVILAGILLKLGSWGFIKYLVLFPHFTSFLSPLIWTICLLGVYISSFNAIRQIDIKKLFAYTSIAHMNFSLFGIFNIYSHAFLGTFYLSIAHGFVSAALFFLIGFLYDRYHTRILLYFRGLVIFMPFYSTFFFLFSFSNIAFPGTLNFVGELFILLYFYSLSWYTFLFLIFSLFLGVIYSLWLFNRICLGIPTTSFHYFSDLLFFEFFILFFLFFFTIIFGFFPTLILPTLPIFYYLVSKKLSTKVNRLILPIYKYIPISFLSLPFKPLWQINARFLTFKYISYIRIHIRPLIAAKFILK